MKRIKDGVELYSRKNSSEYLLGILKSGTLEKFIRIHTQERKFIALQLLAGKSSSVILATADLDSQILWEMMQELEALQLIDTTQNSLKVSPRFVSKIDTRVSRNVKNFADASFLQLQRRSNPELHQTNWIDGVNDSGVEILSARQNYLVELSGRNRVTTILYSLLLLSGVTHTRFTPNSRGLALTIGDLDIGVGTLLPSEFGKDFNSHSEALRKDLSLFPLEREYDYLAQSLHVDLRVHCGDVEPEKLSLWMSTHQNFLYIPSPRADTAHIGPLVIPGNSPCVRCATLFFNDHNGIEETLEITHNNQREYPQIAAHYVAALAASQILSYIDGLTTGAQKAELVGNVITIDYQFLAHPQTIAIPRHPLCGCAF
jgi:hypothetical protein